MIFWLSLVILLAISFFMALGSLYAEIAKPKHLKHIKEKLEKEKILFQKK